MSAPRLFNPASLRTTDFHYASQGWTVSQHVRTVGYLNGRGKWTCWVLGLTACMLQLQNSYDILDKRNLYWVFETDHIIDTYNDKRDSSRTA